MALKYIFTSLLFILLVSCGGSNSEKHEPKYKLAVFWDNYAYGEEHKGVYLTDNGELFSFVNNVRLIDYDGIALNETYSEDFLDYLVGRNSLLLEQVDQEPLSELTTKIINVENDDITEEKWRCFDTGKVLFVTFKFQPSNGNYTPVLLEIKGDWTQKNNSQSAIELSNWLDSKLREYQLANPLLLDTCKF